MKRSEIRIYDARGGQYRVKLYGKNGEQLSTSEPLTTPRNVVKNIDAQVTTLSRIPYVSCAIWFERQPIDHTKGQYFARKYGWPSGLRTTKKK